MSTLEIMGMISQLSLLEKQELQDLLTEEIESDIDALNDQITYN